MMNVICPTKELVSVTVSDMNNKVGMAHCCGDCSGKETLLKILRN